jgi:hypothetical protein
MSPRRPQNSREPTNQQPGKRVPGARIKPKPKAGIVDRAIDKLDRIARRPMIEGDYMPGSGKEDDARDKE